MQTLYGWLLPDWNLILGVVGLLGRFVSLYFGLLLVWTLLRGSRPKHARRWMRWLYMYGRRRRTRVRFHAHGD